MVEGAVVALRLAAAPTFAAMALLDALNAGGGTAALCAAAPDGARLTGMTAMYLLMSVFHAGPWLRRFDRAAGRGARDRPYRSPSTFQMPLAENTVLSPTLSRPRTNTSERVTRTTSG